MIMVSFWHAAAEAKAAENVCEMEVCESSSLTAVANKSLDMSRSLTEKIAADTADSDDDDDAGVANSVVAHADHSGIDKQVIELSHIHMHAWFLFNRPIFPELLQVRLLQVRPVPKRKLWGIVVAEHYSYATVR